MDCAPKPPAATDKPRGRCQTVIATTGHLRHAKSRSHRPFPLHSTPNLRAGQAGGRVRRACEAVLPSGTSANVSATVLSSVATSRRCDGSRAARSSSRAAGYFSGPVALSAQIVRWELRVALGARR